MPFHFNTRLGRASGAFALLFTLVLSAVLRADDQDQKGDTKDEQHSLSDDTGEALGKLKPLLDAKNWSGAVDLLNRLIPKTDPNSYDLAVILDTKAKVLLQQGAYADAIPPMEESLRLSDAHHFFSPKQSLEDVDYLAKLYYAESGNAKKPKAEQERDLEHAETYLQREISSSPKVDPENEYFYATILYNEAVTRNAEKPDLDLIRRSQEQLQHAMTHIDHPKDSMYVLLLADLQQQGDFAHGAEILEYLVSVHPENKTYWQQLAGTYLNLASANDKDARESRKYFIRAINAYERAQAHGILKSGKDNYNLVTIYYNVGQFGKATDLLDSGLRNGSINPDVKNWQLLSYSYQQSDKLFQAIDALKEAQKLNPDDGQLDFQIGQIYQQMDKSAEAYPYYYAAVRKKHPPDRIYNVYTFLAYDAYELQKYSDALEAVESAEKLPEARRDKQLPRLKKAIEDALKEHEASVQADKKQPL